MATPTEDQSAPRWRQDLRGIIIVIIVIAALIGAGLWWFLKPVSADGLSGKLRDSMQSELSTNPSFSAYDMTVGQVTVMRKDGNEFAGTVEVTAFSGTTGTVPVDITYDGDNLMWRTQPGAFLFLMQRAA